MSTRLGRSFDDDSSVDSPEQFAREDPDNKAGGLTLSGQVKSGQRWSRQNRPMDVAQDLDVVPCRSHFGQA